MLFGTSVGFGQYAEKSYIDEASKYLDFEYINLSVPGLAIHTNEDGSMLTHGSFTMTLNEYVKQNINLASAPVVPYIPGGEFNGYYRTYERAFTKDIADADLYIYAVAPNNNNFALTDWEAFDCDKWEYKDGSSFADHRSTFIGAILFMMNEMYSLNPNARMSFLLDSPFSYEAGKQNFEVLNQKWQIPIINLFGKINYSPKSALKLKSLNGTNDHPSTFAHETMGKMLAGELLLIS